MRSDNDILHYVNDSDSGRTDILKIEYLENKKRKQIAAKRGRAIIITGFALFLLYGFYLIQHLQEEHHAGHHILYFVIAHLFHPLDYEKDGRLRNIVQFA